MSAIPSFAYIRKSHVPMRESPDVKSKVVSDALYSENVTVLEKKNRWIRIQTDIDHYEGWIQENKIVSYDKDFFHGQTVAKVSRIKAFVYSVEDTEFGYLMSLPCESRLKLEEPDAPKKRWIKVVLIDKRQAFIQWGDVTINPQLLSMQEMLEFSKKFLGVPYMWGGRSSWGIDCSGFTQLCYGKMGVPLPRDSKDQLNCDKLTSVAIKKMQPGDLIFWGMAIDKIRHVGMYLGKNNFIHSTVKEYRPHVHISQLQDEDWNGKGALPFRAVRRLKREIHEQSVPKSYIFIAAASLAASILFRLLRKPT